MRHISLDGDSATVARSVHRDRYGVWVDVEAVELVERNNLSGNRPDKLCLYRGRRRTEPGSDATTVPHVL